MGSKEYKVFGFEIHQRRSDNNQLCRRSTAKIERGLSTELAKLGTFRGSAKEWTRLPTYF